MLDVSDQERGKFYEHMGHSSDINRDVYQAPPAITTITSVGRHLYTLDQGNIVIHSWRCGDAIYIVQLRETINSHSYNV